MTDEEWQAQSKSEDTIRAILDTNNHCRSVIFAIDEFLHCAATMSKDELVANFTQDRDVFKARIREITASPARDEAE